jgi:hypothetical protein
VRAAQGQDENQYTDRHYCTANHDRPTVRARGRHRLCLASLFLGAPRGFRFNSAAFFIGTLPGLGLRLSAALLLLRKPFGFGLLLPILFRDALRFGLLLPIFFRDPLSFGVLAPILFSDALRFGFILLALRFFAGAPPNFLLRTPVGVYRRAIRY